MIVNFTQMPRDSVISYLSGSWPPRPGTTTERVAFLSDTACGAVGVQEGSRPGTSWWVVDGLMPTQDAGPLPQLEGDLVETIPDPPPDSPPIETP